MTPSISVIVLNWNGRAHLEACFEALARQTCRDFETIMVDNGSTDDSVQLVRGKFPWVRVVALTANRGFPGGNAAGLAEAQGRGIVLLNNDTRPEPDWLEQLQAGAAAHPEAGIIASHLTNWDGTLTDSAGDGCRVTGRGYGRHRGQPAATAPGSGPVFGACAGAAWYRREMIAQVGFLDEDFFLGFEDTDLAFRAQWAGWSVWFCREAVVRHRMSATQGAWTAINTFYGARNHLWVWIKNVPARVQLLYAPMMLAEAGLLSFHALRSGQGWTYVRGILAGLRGFGLMYAKRRSARAGRRRSARDMAGLLTGVGSLNRLRGGGVRSGNTVNAVVI